MISRRQKAQELEEAGHSWSSIAKLMKISIPEVVRLTSKMPQRDLSPSKQILGYIICRFLRKRKTDPSSTRWVVELNNGCDGHRTCLNSDLRIVKDEILCCPSEEESECTEEDFLFTVEAT